ncbi:hypothetical protein DIPPA_18367 [Diplonema papillatum]|nr:hypothetical protein DIPPA_18367 [Diplonema papillatum]
MSIFETVCAWFDVGFGKRYIKPVLQECFLSRTHYGELAADDLDGSSWQELHLNCKAEATRNINTHLGGQFGIQRGCLYDVELKENENLVEAERAELTVFFKRRTAEEAASLTGEEIVQLCSALGLSLFEHEISEVLKADGRTVLDFSKALNVSTKSRMLLRSILTLTSQAAPSSAFADLTQRFLSNRQRVSQCLLQMKAHIGTVTLDIVVDRGGQKPVVFKVTARNVTWDAGAVSIGDLVVDSSVLAVGFRMEEEPSEAAAGQGSEDARITTVQGEDHPLIRATDLCFHPLAPPQERPQAADTAGSVTIHASADWQLVQDAATTMAQPSVDTPVAPRAEESPAAEDQQPLADSTRAPPQPGSASSASLKVKKFAVEAAGGVTFLTNNLQVNRSAGAAAAWSFSLPWLQAWVGDEMVEVTVPALAGTVKQSFKRHAHPSASGHRSYAAYQVSVEVAPAPVEGKLQLRDWAALRAVVEAARSACVFTYGLNSSGQKSVIARSTSVHVRVKVPGAVDVVEESLSAQNPNDAPVGKRWVVKSVECSAHWENARGLRAWALSTGDVRMGDERSQRFTCHALSMKADHADVPGSPVTITEAKNPVFKHPGASNRGKTNAASGKVGSPGDPPGASPLARSRLATPLAASGVSQDLSQSVAVPAAFEPCKLFDAFACVFESLPLASFSYNGIYGSTPVKFVLPSAEVKLSGVCVDATQSSTEEELPEFLAVGLDEARRHSGDCLEVNFEFRTAQVTLVDDTAKAALLLVEEADGRMPSLKIRAYPLKVSLALDAPRATVSLPGLRVGGGRSVPWVFSWTAVQTALLQVCNLFSRYYCTEVTVPQVVVGELVVESPGEAHDPTVILRALDASATGLEIRPSLQRLGAAGIPLSPTHPLIFSLASAGLRRCDFPAQGARAENLAVTGFAFDAGIVSVAAAGARSLAWDRPGATGAAAEAVFRRLLRFLEASAAELAENRAGMLLYERQPARKQPKTKSWLWDTFAAARPPQGAAGGAPAEKDDQPPLDGADDHAPTAAGTARRAVVFPNWFCQTGAGDAAPLGPAEGQGEGDAAATAPAPVPPGPAGVQAPAAVITVAALQIDDCSFHLRAPAAAAGGDAGAAAGDVRVSLAVGGGPQEQRGTPALRVEALHGGGVAARLRLPVERVVVFDCEDGEQVVYLESAALVSDAEAASAAGRETNHHHHHHGREAAEEGRNPAETAGGVAGLVASPSSPGDVARWTVTTGAVIGDGENKVFTHDIRRVLRCVAAFGELFGPALGQRLALRGRHGAAPAVTFSVDRSLPYQHPDVVAQAALLRGFAANMNTRKGQWDATAPVYEHTVTLPVGRDGSCWGDAKPGAVSFGSVLRLLVEAAEKSHGWINRAASMVSSDKNKAKYDALLRQHAEWARLSAAERVEQRDKSKRETLEKLEQALEGADAAAIHAVLSKLAQRADLKALGQSLRVDGLVVLSGETAEKYLASSAASQGTPPPNPNPSPPQTRPPKAGAPPPPPSAAAPPPPPAPGGVSGVRPPPPGGAKGVPPPPGGPRPPGAAAEKVWNLSRGVPKLAKRKPTLAPTKQFFNMKPAAVPGTVWEKVAGVPPDLFADAARLGDAQEYERPPAAKPGKKVAEKAAPPKSALSTDRVQKLGVPAAKLENELDEQEVLDTIRNFNVSNLFTEFYGLLGEFIKLPDDEWKKEAASLKAHPPGPHAPFCEKVLGAVHEVSRFPHRFRLVNKHRSLFAADGESRVAVKGYHAFSAHCARVLEDEEFPSFLAAFLWWSQWLCKQSDEEEAAAAAKKAAAPPPQKPKPHAPGPAASGAKATPPPPPPAPSASGGADGGASAGATAGGGSKATPPPPPPAPAASGGGGDGGTATSSAGAATGGVSKATPPPPPPAPAASGGGAAASSAAATAGGVPPPPPAPGSATTSSGTPSGAPAKATPPPPPPAPGAGGAKAPPPPPPGGKLPPPPPMGGVPSKADTAAAVKGRPLILKKLNALEKTRGGASMAEFLAVRVSRTLTLSDQFLAALHAVAADAGEGDRATDAIHKEAMDIVDQVSKERSLALDELSDWPCSECGVSNKKSEQYCATDGCSGECPQQQRPVLSFLSYVAPQEWRKMAARLDEGKTKADATRAEVYKYLGVTAEEAKETVENLIVAVKNWNKAVEEDAKNACKDKEKDKDKDKPTKGSPTAEPAQKTQEVPFHQRFANAMAKRSAVLH